MIAILEGPGLLRVQISMVADLSLLIVTGAAGTLMLGMVLAWMISSLWLSIVPGLPGNRLSESAATSRVPLT
jgi:hypothetical protein